MENAFLRAIADDPDDLVSRWVYADWLNEQDDPRLVERSEFLRVQFALAEKMNAEERKRFREREQELMEKLRPMLEEPVRDRAVSWEFRNGFAERLTLDCDQLFALADLAARTPVVRVRLRGLTLETATELAQSPALEHLCELVLESEDVNGAAIGALMRSPQLTRLRYLNLARNPLFDDGVRAVVASPVFDRLRYLNLSEVGISRAGVRHLLAAIEAGQGHALERLHLRGALRDVPQRDLPPLSRSVPHLLRSSLECQLSLPKSGRDLIRELKESPLPLSRELRAFVGRLHAQPTGLVDVLKSLPLPSEVQRAFAAVCERRAVWRAQRTKTRPFVFSPDLETDAAELAGAVRALSRLGEPEKEAARLAQCLLDLWQRHEVGELRPDGRTR